MGQAGLLGPQVRGFVPPASARPSDSVSLLLHPDMASILIPVLLLLLLLLVAGVVFWYKRRVRG